MYKDLYDTKRIQDLKIEQRVAIIFLKELWTKNTTEPREID